MAVNKEIIDKQSSCPECSNEELREEKAVEGGNIFSLGTRFSEAMDLTYQDENGEGQYPIMGCYGIGLGRVMGIVVEVLSDDDGIVWPESIAPFQVHMVSLGDDEEVEQRAENLYSDLQDKGVEVLWDDRNASAGEKFSDSDLLGIPHRVVVSSKTLDDKSVGHKPRISDEEKRISTDELLSLLEE